MALTKEQVRLQQASTLRALIARLIAAKEGDDLDELASALQAMVDFQAGTPFEALQAEAAQARNDAAEEIAAEALEALARTADRVRGAAADFKTAATIAEKGEKNLLFPALATAAAQGLELMKQFQAAIEAVQQNIANVDELGDVPDAVKGVFSAFEALKDKVDELG